MPGSSPENRFYPQGLFFFSFTSLVGPSDIRRLAEASFKNVVAWKAEGALMCLLGVKGFCGNCLQIEFSEHFKMVDGAVGGGHTLVAPGR